MLSKQSIENYRLERQKLTGEAISDEKAQDEAEFLLRCYEGVYKALKKLHEESNGTDQDYP